MALMETPRSNRLHIAFYGRRNAGKSSLINMVTAQRTALVSEHAGTTTDPVIKSMELLPLGPIAVIDTAGLDDTGELGALRIERSKEMMDRTDRQTGCGGDRTAPRRAGGRARHPLHRGLGDRQGLPRRAALGDCQERADGL